MEVSTKSTIFLIFAALGLLLQIIVFSIPGWFVFDFPVSINDYPDNWSPGNVDPYPSYRTTTWHPRPVLYRTRKSISAGLWYFIACIESHDGLFDYYRKGRHHFQECYHSTFEDADDKVYDIPDEAYPLKDIYNKVGVAGPLGLLEFRIEACLGLILSILGIVFLGIYKHGGCQVRGVGLTAFFSLTVSGVLYWAAVGKVATTTVLAYLVFAASDWDVEGVPIPYAPILGAFGATSTLIGAIGLLYILTRGHPEAAQKYTGKGCNVPFQQMPSTPIN